MTKGHNRPICRLALEDGAVFTGTGLGATGLSEGEAVFNTSMTGYQEILTDPSYAGQIVTMTYPLIGNYGVNARDAESKRPHVAGFVIKELSPVVSTMWQRVGGGTLAQRLRAPSPSGSRKSTLLPSGVAYRM